MDYEYEEVVRCEALRPCTPWTFACLANTLTRDGKVLLRTEYENAWKKYVKPIAAKSVAHTQKAWLVVRSFTELMNYDLTLSVVVGGPKDLMD